MSDQLFDLFGDPVPANWGKRGRPQHVPTQEFRNKVSLLVALGWSNERIAAAIFVTPPTLRKHYFSELKYRDVARDRLDAARALNLFQEAMKGNVGAHKEFQQFLERNDLMLYGQKARAPDADKPAKQPAIGKKEAALIAAQQPDDGTTLGSLMAQRQGSKPN